MPSSRKPYNDRAGYVASLRSGANNGWVVIYKAEAQGVDVGGARYAVVCETHCTLWGATSLKDARTLMKSVGFCEACESANFNLHGEIGKEGDIGQFQP